MPGQAAHGGSPPAAAGTLCCAGFGGTSEVCRTLSHPCFYSFTFLSPGIQSRSCSETFCLMCFVPLMVSLPGRCSSGNSSIVIQIESTLIDHCFKFLTGSARIQWHHDSTRGVCALCFRLCSLCSDVLCQQIGLFMWKVLLVTAKKEYTVGGISPGGFICYWEL